MATNFPVGADTSKAVSEIDRLIAEIRKAGKEVGLTEGQIQKMVDTSRKGSVEGSKHVNEIRNNYKDLNSTIRTVGSTILTVFAADQLKTFVKDVVDITSQFQRLEAVLTNTLGSQSKARAALQDIQKLAAKTPFSVLELTENFIKLANRGVKPTMEQMTKLGDVAATLGKPFEQVVEALLDINNPERWKEIGIHAETAGSKVKLSFRGATVEVDRTVQGVTDAVAKLGEMQGVAGAMVAISGTLGGKISNLGDSWNQFLATIGDSEKGVLTGVISLLDMAINKARELVTTDQQRAEHKSLEVYNEQLEKVKAIYSTTKDINIARDQAIQNLHAELEAIDKGIKNNDGRISDYKNNGGRLHSADEQRAYTATLAQRNLLVARYNDLVNEGQKAIIEFAKETAKNDAANVFHYTPEQLKIQEQVAKRQAQYTRDARSRADAEAQERADKLRWLQQYTDGLEDLRNRFGKAAVPFDEAAIQGMIEAGAPDKEQGITDADIKAAKEDGEKIHQFNMRELFKETVDFTISGLQQIAQFQQAQNQQEISDLQAKQEYELSLAGNNEGAKQRIQKEFAARQKQLQQEQAQRARDIASFEIILNTARGITSALAVSNIPLSIFIGAQGAIQLALANATKLPKFAEGVFGLDGPGTEKSDSILARLSVNESIVPAEKSRRFKAILKPMIEKDINLMDVRNIIDTTLPDHPNAIRIINTHGVEMYKLLKELQETRRELSNVIKNKKETHLIFDEDGFSHKVHQNGNWTTYVKKRYKI